MQDENIHNNEELEGTTANDAYENEPVEEFVEVDNEGDELSGTDIVKKLREKVKKLESEKAEYLNSWQRALADYKNREMQISKEKQEWGQMAVRDFAEELLTVMDTYDAARSNRSAWESVDANWRAGIEYIFDTFENKLKAHGFEKYGHEDELFNPELHEGLGTVAIDAAHANKVENNIAQVIMSGYKYNGKVIRPAKVKVWTN